MCGLGLSDQDGNVAFVTCPSRLCSGLIPVVGGRIGEHDAVVVHGRCPWIGVGVVDDRASAPTVTRSTIQEGEAA
jgi:hypothetical protein